ncbi:MAG: PadR family transcriptional regulator [Candidatus Bathyarchaeota archaeon]|nr:PadR family transcriptional regulator [Candidatus Bathyarchaeota archaeon]
MEDDQEKQLKHTFHSDNHLLFHRRNWLRHTAMVPKGFLRYHVLEALNKKAMSGSELMDEIQKNTGGNWKPSPGSIYPLLAWLQDNAYIKELPTENGFKRYELTQNGKDLLEEQRKIREKFDVNSGFMVSPLFNGFFSNIPQDKMIQIRASMKRLLFASIKIGKTLRGNYSEKVVDDALKILDEASKKLEEMNEKLKVDKHE